MTAAKKRARICEKKTPYKCAFCGEMGWRITTKRVCCDKCKGEYARLYNIKWRAARKAAKKCARCGNVHSGGKTYCNSCLVKIRAKMSAAYRKLLTDGKCFQCRQPNDYIKHNKWLCRKCATDIAEKKRLRRAAIRAAGQKNHTAKKSCENS